MFGMQIYIHQGGGECTFDLFALDWYHIKTGSNITDETEPIEYP